MLRGDRLELKTISLLAVVDGNRAWLLDQAGRPIRNAIAFDRVTSVADSSKANRLIWSRTADRVCKSLKARVKRNLPSQKSPWMAKAETLAVSFRRRDREQRRPRGRCRFEVYATTTWSDAAKRMADQIRNRFRLDQRTSWDRWAFTVSNNQNKRARIRDAEAAQCVA